MLQTILKADLRTLVSDLRAIIFAGLVALPLSVNAQTPLSNGGNHAGTISANSVDPYTFNGTAGDTVILRVGATNFAPKIDLHGPGGALLESAPATAPGGGSRDALISLRLTA